MQSSSSKSYISSSLPSTSNPSEKVTPLLAELSTTQKRFKDSEFNGRDNVNDVLFKGCKDSILIEELTDVRFRSLSGNFGNPGDTLFGEVTSNSLTQGILGDCYFISAVSSLCDTPQLLTRLFDMKKINQTGIYSIWLFVQGRWKQFIIDDAVPVFYLKGGGITPAFCKTKNNNPWIMLLEKAYAKSKGSYALIDGGDPADVYESLTGSPCFRIKHLSSTVIHDRFILLQRIRNMLRAGYPISACTRNSKLRNQKLENGLFLGHAYSILDTKEITTWDSYSQSKDYLLKIRDPWGQIEFQGKWATANSTLWNQAIGIIEFPLPCSGIFWMTINEFIRSFSEVCICLALPDNHNLELDSKGKFTVFTPNLFTIWSDSSCNPNSADLIIKSNRLVHLPIEFAGKHQIFHGFLESGEYSVILQNSSSSKISISTSINATVGGTVSMTNYFKNISNLIQKLESGSVDEHSGGSGSVIMRILRSFWS